MGFLVSSCVSLVVGGMGWQGVGLTPGKRNLSVQRVSLKDIEKKFSICCRQSLIQFEVCRCKELSHKKEIARKLF